MSKLEEIFELNVIGTMINGKSTLINAMLHTELLPMDNKAYTTPLCRILGNDNMVLYEGECYKEDRTAVGKRAVITPELLKTYYENEEISYIDLEGGIPAVSNSDIKLCLTDIPAPNNCRGDYYSIIKRTIDRPNAMLLYVMNAAQIGMMDDKRLLKIISSEIKRAGKQPKDKVLFVINKCDQLDEISGKTIDRLLENVRAYLKSFDIVEPTLIPTSARLALLIRKNREGQPLFRKEKHGLYAVEEFVEEDFLHFEQYATLSPVVREKLLDEAEMYHADEETWDMEALIHTGIPALEETICECMDKYACAIGLKDDIPAETALLARNFFAKTLKVDTKKMYPMLVMATMSSGKSTLINALLGQQILPSKNEACTAKMYAILDDDQNDIPQLYITDIHGKTVLKEENLAEELSAANQDDNVSDIFIRGQVKGVLNTDKALLIVDTPGPNNARDLSHGEIMRDVLEKVNGGLILYVMNATQMGINDDKYLLNLLRAYLSKHEKSEVIFVLNKVDQIDEERESVEQLVLLAREYLIDNGFEKPNLIPVSALAAMIFKKVLQQEELTRSEFRAFEEYYELYRPRDFNMKSYAITGDFPNQFEEVEVRGEKYRIGNLIRAIENTGIKVLEDAIQKAQILGSGKLKNIIKLK